MTTPIRHLVLVLATLAALMSTGRATGEGEVSDLSGRDWWSWTAPRLLPAESLREVPVAEPEITALLKQAAAHPPLNLDPSGEVNSLCWALEILGHSEHPQAGARVKPFLRHASWRVRTAAFLALGRLGRTEDLVAGLGDTEWVTLREDERLPGESGSADLCQPVVLAALKSLLENSRRNPPVDLSALLSGLRHRPLRSITYDRTPEPFPDWVTEQAPPWYREGVSQVVKQLGTAARPHLLKELKKPDDAFVRVSGGYRSPGAVLGPDTVHRFLRSLLNG